MVMDTQSTIYLVSLFHMINMGVQVEICAREVIYRVKKNGKPTNFCNILYCLNVIFVVRFLGP
jgi:hypothetical protein